MLYIQICYISQKQDLYFIALHYSVTESKKTFNVNETELNAQYLFTLG